MSSYNTRWRCAVVSFFAANQERGFTPDEVVASLEDVPRSTIYRLLSQLFAEGILRKTATEGRKAVFQYQGAECSMHMHIRCRICGRTEHLDEKSTRMIERIVESSSGYRVLDSTVFEGICRECEGRNT